MPADQDPTESNSNAPATAYWFSQNVLASYIQYSGDADFQNFVAPKTVNRQEIRLIPPYGKNHMSAIYEHLSGDGTISPIAFSISNGNVTSIYANLEAGKAYTILVLTVDGTYDVDQPYYFGLPGLFN